MENGHHQPRIRDLLFLHVESMKQNILSFNI